MDFSTKMPKMKTTHEWKNVSWKRWNLTNSGNVASTELNIFSYASSVALYLTHLCYFERSVTSSIEGYSTKHKKAMQILNDAGYI